MVDEKSGFQCKIFVVTLWSQKLLEKEILEIIPLHIVIRNYEKPPHRPQAMAFKTNGNNSKNSKKRVIPTVFRIRSSLLISF